MQIRNLATHPARYITVAELAEYWAVSKQQIYKRIESGALGTIRLGTRLYRIPTRLAAEFERQARVQGSGGKNAPGRGQAGNHLAAPRAPAFRLPAKIGLRRVNGTNGL